MLFTDKLEGLNQGKWNDFYYKVGLGLNFYLGNPFNSVKPVMFE
jgi:curli production assembly/transport component CsgG